MVFIPPEIVVFEHPVFGGNQRRFNVDIGELDWYLTDDILGEYPKKWTERISSVIVISGTWQFYSGPNYTGVRSLEVGPGYYSYVENSNFLIPNDSITSFKVISYEPQSNGVTSPIIPEIIVFGNTGFGGGQRHFNHDVFHLGGFAAGKDEQSGLVTTWDNGIGSVIVISGTWQFYSEPNHTGIQSLEVGPGTYSNVEIPEFNIAQGSISSFKVISYDPQGDGFVWL
jgi:hypothetical protein